ncbi:exocyst complex component Sec10-like protein [Schizophyllum commune]
MERFTTLEPVRLYASNAAGHFLNTHAPAAPARAPENLVGRLPSELHYLVLSYASVMDIAAYARCSHATAAIAQAERVWEPRWKALHVEDRGLGDVLDDLEERAKGKAAVAKAAAPPTLAVDDDFGDFASGSSGFDAPAADADEMGDFVGAFGSVSVTSSAPLINLPSAKTIRAKYSRAHNLLKPLTRLLSSPPHMVLSELASQTSPTIRQQAKLLRLLASFLTSTVNPLHRWETLYSSLRLAIDRFDANLLSAFDVADSQGDEAGMRDAAESSWAIYDGTGDWEMGKVWTEKREIFYELGKWNALDNLTEDGRLDFDAMDGFMTFILKAIKEHGSRAARVFPPESEVVLLFAQRVANELVGEYVTELLTRAREFSLDTYLKAAAATFRESWRMVDAISEAASARPESVPPRTKVEDVVYQMFEINMDEYLDDEIESVKLAFEAICKEWDKQMAQAGPRAAHADTAEPSFLGSQNPAQMKRNVLASFTDVLLLPVTIVPRTMGAVGGVLKTGGTAVGSAAVQGIAMLNPQRWGGAQNVNDGYSRNLDRDGDGENTVFEIGDDDYEEGEDEEKVQTPSRASMAESSEATTSTVATPSSNNRSSVAPSIASSTTTLTTAPAQAVNQFELLLSLDIALQLIHADREALKRAETFAGYPGHYGHRVRDTIEEIFVLLLQALSEKHLSTGFAAAIEQMRAYRPAEHEETTSVAPLLQFFELVHIGDTMQSMVQVYFDKEMASHIDRTDFLNPVVREKKRFENALDDSVAAGLNAGTDVLMNQVEHIIMTLTQPREYYPPEDSPLELGPTKACTEAIKCLQMHCKLLKGSTSKEVLEVFYQEVGIRLIAILQKHIKRQIISLSGGFQVIADLNTYHNFIVSLKVPSIAAEFSHLKMLGHVYVVEDAKDLAQIVRDVTRYGGAYRPEDVYEFIQRRSDWKKIEKAVDKTMYNLSFKEDCVVC